MALEKIHGIVIDIIKHSDRHNVVTLYTRERGRISFLTAAGNGKSARLRNAAIMPLSIIATDAEIRPARQLQFLRNFQRDTLWHDIYFSPVKSTVALFLTEFLNNFLRESPPDAVMWDFIAASCAVLDRADKGIANFHIAFLLSFLHFAGIRPDTTQWRDGRWFDLRDGTFSIAPPPHRDTIVPGETSLLPLLARMNMRTFPLFRFNAMQRRNLTGTLLRYYSIHFPGLSALKSPAVLAEVFG